LTDIFDVQVFRDTIYVILEIKVMGHSSRSQDENVAKWSERPRVRASF